MSKEQKEHPKPEIYECPDCKELVNIDERDYSIPPCPGCNYELDEGNKAKHHKNDEK